MIAARDGWTVFTFPPEPLPGCYLAGCKDGALHWTYGQEFLGLHNSQRANPPKHPGEIIGTTRLLGQTFLVGDRKTDPIELWAINGNRGNIYLFTTDGLLAANLFQDYKTAEPWPEEERRGADLNQMSLLDECFFPSIQQTEDGRVYLVAGKSFSAIFQITGLESIRRLPDQQLTITHEDISAAREYLASQASASSE